MNRKNKRIVLKANDKDSMVLGGADLAFGRPKASFERSIEQATTATKLTAAVTGNQDF